jgi:chloramphenicol 3-O-phosphotransferase
MMNVGMRFAGRIGRLVRMLVVLVVGVKMLMGHCVMMVGVSMPLGKMEPYTNSHEATRHPEERRWLLAQYDQRQRRANKGSGGKVSASSCGADVSKR